MDTLDFREKTFIEPEVRSEDLAEEPTEAELPSKVDPLEIARQFQRLEYYTEQDLQAKPKEPLTLREKFELRRRGVNNYSRLRLEPPSIEAPPRIRSGIAHLIHDHDWIQLFSVIPSEQLTLTERAYLFQQIEPDVDDPDLLPLVGVIRQLLAGQDRDTHSHGITLRPELQDFVCVMMDGSDNLDRYKTHLMKLDAPARKDQLRTLVTDVKEAMANQNSTEAHLESTRPEPVGHFIEPLVREHGRDISVIREVVSEQFEAGLQSGEASSEDYLKALAIVNPGRLLALCIDGDLPESQVSKALDACLLEDPQMVVNACEQGRLPQTVLEERVSALTIDNPAYAITHLDSLSDSPEQRSQIALNCFRNGKLEVLFQALENGSPELNLDDDTLTKVRVILRQRLEEGYSQIDSPDRKLRYIRRLAAYPLISQEPLLGELRDRFDCETADALYPHIVAFMEKLKDEGLDAYQIAEKIFKEFSIQNGTQFWVDDLFTGSKYGSSKRPDGIRLDDYSFFPSLSKKQQRCLLGMSIIRNNRSREMLEVAYELTEPEVLKPYAAKMYVPEYPGNALMAVILEQTAPTDGYAVSTIEHIVNTNEVVPGKIKDELVEWLMRGIGLLDEQLSTMQDHESPDDQIEIEHFAFLVLSLKEDALTDRYVSLLSKFPDKYYLELPGQTEHSIFGRLLQAIPPHQQEKLLWSQTNPLSTLCIFSQLQFGGKERKRELFNALKHSGNAFINQFTDYAQYVAYLQEFPFFHSVDQVRSALDLHSRIGDERWKLFAKAARQDPGILDFVAKTPMEVLELVLTTESPFIKGLLLSNPRLLVRLNITDHDIQFLTDTATNVQVDIPRLIADLSKLGIDISDEHSRYLEGKVITPDGSKETREKEKQIKKIINAYTLVKWQSYKTGMTVDQISEVLASLRDVDRTVDLHALQHHGIWGENLKALYDKRGSAIRAVQENSVVGRGLLDLFATSDFIQTLDHIISHSTTLSTTDPEWERLTTIATDIVIKRGARGPAPSIFVDGKWEAVTDENVVIFRSAIKDQIERVCTLHPLEKQAASQRNVQLAKDLVHERDGFVIPHGTYTHVALSGSLGGILGTGNFAGECLGRFNSGTDSYPGYVDLQQVDAVWGEQVTMGTLLKSQHIYTKGSGHCAIIYLEDSLGSKATKLESHIHGHYLVPGAIPTVDVSMVLCEEIDEEDLESAKVASILSGVYVPLVDSKTFELLFTPEEYEMRYREFKRFKTLGDLINSPDVYESDLYDLPNTNPVYTIAEHMDRVCDCTRQMLARVSLSNELEVIVLAAAKLHDVGKLEPEAQEIANVTKASAILDRVADLTIEQKRQILLLIRHDELLGEILKAVEILDGGEILISRLAERKMQQLERVFSDLALRKALILLYQADVRGIGGTEWQDWKVEEKLRGLGLPVFSIDAQD